MYYLKILTIVLASISISTLSHASEGGGSNKNNRLLINSDILNFWNHELGTNYEIPVESSSFLNNRQISSEEGFSDTVEIEAHQHNPGQIGKSLNEQSSSPLSHKESRLVEKVYDTDKEIFIGTTDELLKKGPFDSLNLYEGNNSFKRIVNLICANYNQEKFLTLSNISIVKNIYGKLLSDKFKFSRFDHTSEKWIKMSEELILEEIEKKVKKNFRI